MAPLLIALLAAGIAAPPAGASGAAPPIRTSPANRVPACVTPAALNRFLADNAGRRGGSLAPRFRDIAVHYQRHGLAHDVRWDFAFFQMVLETNFLTFRRGDGKPGDVTPDQNNFAGLGTTGGGVPGDRYPDVSTGVLAQIQHLVVYSGERLAEPVGHRTRLKQDVILNSVERIRRQRPVTFADLARRWAADRHYGRSIMRVSVLFLDGYCRAPENAITARAEPPPPRSARPAATPPRSTQRPTGERQLATASVPAIASPPAAPVAAPVAAPTDGPAAVAPRPLASSGPKLRLTAPTSDRSIRSCQVQVASYGGERAVLIESIADNTVSLTALNVHPGFEVAMASNFIQSYAPNGQTIGAYETRSAALTKAHEICRRHRADSAAAPAAK